MRSGGGLGKMTRRKREIAGLANEQDFPHLVELALPPGGFRTVFLEIGRSTEVAKETLEALEESLRAFDRQRRLLLDRLNEGER
jgi:hypothetical protein